MSKVECVTVSLGVTRSRQCQTMKFGLSEEVVLDEDDGDAVVKDSRHVFK